MVGVNFKRVTVVDNKREFEEQLKKYSVQNGSHIRKQAMSIMNNNTSLSSQSGVSSHEQVR